MDQNTEKHSQWSSHELDLLNHVEVFLHKPKIMKKAERYLNALGEEMIRELAQSRISFPAETKLEKVQLTRGENHKGFPYLSLDIPQRFSKMEMFTYRTLFWWGHYLGFSLILKGDDIPRYTSSLLNNKTTDHFHNVYLAAAPTPWEWSLTAQNFTKISDTSGEELRKIVEEVDYIKLLRFYPVNSESFAELDWVTAGVTAWRDLSTITET
jgi:hypothetical protein